MVRLGILIVFLLMASCSSTKSSVTSHHVRDLSIKNDTECNIQFVEDKELGVNGYLLIGEIESHIKRNLFTGWVADLERDVQPEVKKQACSLGATHVIIDNIIETSAAEFKHIHIWARAFKKN